MESLKAVIRSLPQVLWNLGLIAVGSALCAVAINGILIPRHFLSGGFTGLALILHYILPSLPLGGIYFLLNMPNYAFGWKYVGRRFFVYSVAGMFIFSAAIQGIHVALPVYDQLLSAILAGIIVGIGSGIILKSLGSAGGTDILSVILVKRFSIRLGTTILAFNSIILGAAALLFSLEKALYTLIYLYISSYMVNLVVTGLSQRKAVFVISPQWKGISQRIMEDIQRGVTIIEGQGAFSGQEQHILYTVITFRELPRLKSLVRSLDPNAFMVVSETLEVMGKRVGNQPHW
ncbi:MAG: YitT family protein [Proteobacteria bacterium]|nr:YitT family protein [Pseudomonadota bacterium]